MAPKTNEEKAYQKHLVSLQSFGESYLLNYADAAFACGFLVTVKLLVNRLMPKIKSKSANVAPTPIPAPCSNAVFFA
jgi:hypothetical protein